jgi:hypothetical protein
MDELAVTETRGALASHRTRKKGKGKKTKKYKDLP